MNLKKLNYGIIGLGIMGGSIAKAIRYRVFEKDTKCGKIYAWDKQTDTLNKAIDDGIIDSAFTCEDGYSALKDVDVLFICLYPHATLDFLKKNKSFLKSGSIVTDISGVKGLFEKELPSILRNDIDFIIGHPMAGGEKEGYSASNADYFINHNYLLIPEDFNKEENIALMENLIKKMGFTRITKTTCQIHDYKIGFTSQLCHVIASALVESAKDENITAFGGGSFEDLTRIAMINAPLWTELFISNKEKLVSHIESFMDEMNLLKNMINEEKTEALTDYLKDVREKRTKMGSIQVRK